MQGMAFNCCDVEKHVFDGVIMHHTTGDPAGAGANVYQTFMVVWCGSWRKCQYVQRLDPAIK